MMAALTHVGCARDHNEDSVSIDEDIGLALVADGVGGQNAGELASSIVSSIVSQQVRKRLTAVGGESLDSIRLDTDILQMVLVSAIVDAHAEVLDVARQSAGRRGMASTVVAALVHGSSAVLGWVGDSSAFLLRDGRLSKPLTKRHTLGAELGNTTDTGSGRPRRVLLTRVVGGTESLFTPEVSVVAVQTGDVLAICSDGVTDMLDPDQLETALSAEAKRRAPITAAIAATPIEQLPANDKLMQAAIEGGRAAFKVHCVQCHGSGAAGSTPPCTSSGSG